MNLQYPVSRKEAAAAELRCIGSTMGMLYRQEIHLGTENVGTRVHFADGTAASIYRETIVDRDAAVDPCALVVKFRLRLVHGGWHSLFRLESLLNTPLFVGFPGFVSKLWLAHDGIDRYRGIYEWDGPARAEHYARCLWRVLEIGCVPGSIEYLVLPHLRRDELLTQASLPRPTSAGSDWWRPVNINEFAR